MNCHIEDELLPVHPEHKAGFVTFLGLPNGGKSSLLNRNLENKVSIVSEKPQTTRRIVRGRLNRPEEQIVFLDTPEYHEPVTIGKIIVALYQAIAPEHCYCVLSSGSQCVGEKLPFLTPGRVHVPDAFYFGAQ